MAERRPAYRFLYKMREAHNSELWTVTWGRVTLTVPVKSVRSAGDLHFPPMEREIDVVITGSLSGMLKMWHVKYDSSIEPIRVIRAHDLGIVSVTLNSQNTKMLTSSMDGTLKLWDVKSGQCTGCFNISPADSCNAVFTKDNKFAVVGSHHGRIRMYNLQSNLQQRKVNTRGKCVLCVAVSPDGCYVAAADTDGFIYIYQYSNGLMVHSIEGHAKPVRSMDFSPDSRKLMSGSDDKFIKIFDVINGQTEAFVSGHTSWVLSVAFSPDGRKYASGSNDLTIKIWDYFTHACLHTFEGHTKAVMGVCFNTYSDRLVSIGQDDAIHIYEIPNDEDD